MLKLISLLVFTLVYVHLICIGIVNRITFNTANDEEFVI